MVSKKNKKMFLYEVEPLFFKDSNNDGFGDFKGFISKIDYLKFLNVDGVIFPDIFNQEKLIAKPLEETIFDKYGNIHDLQQIVFELKNRNIDFYISIDLNNVYSSTLNVAKKNPLKNNDVNIFIKKDISEENWNNQENINSLKKVIEFWKNLGVNKFVIFNFENNGGSFNEILIDRLKEVYRVIKNIDQNCCIALKSDKLENKNINYIFENMYKMCDLYIDNSYSMICTNKNQPYDVMEDFKGKEIVKKLSKLNIPYQHRSRYVISYGNPKIGRPLSRWMNENVLHEEAAKTLLTMTHFLPYSSNNYYGDEIGILRNEFRDIQDFYDFSFIERKRKLESKKFTEQDFLESQQFLSKINSQSLFIWDKTFNFGFSNSNKLIRNFSIKAETINLETQIRNKTSIVNFYKDIIDNFNRNDILNFLNTKTKLKIFTNWKQQILKYKLKNKNYKFLICINPTNQFQKLNISKKYEVWGSTYANKTYNKNIIGLNPYESLILHKLNNK